MVEEKNINLSIPTLMLCFAICVYSLSCFKNETTVTEFTELAKCLQSIHRLEQKREERKKRPNLPYIK